MTAAEVRTIRAELGLTQAEISAALGVDISAWRRWETDPAKDSARAIPEPLARILRLARKSPGLIKRMAAEAEPEQELDGPDMMG